jgi:hypothetical protein
VLAAVERVVDPAGAPEDVHRALCDRLAAEVAPAGLPAA